MNTKTVSVLLLVHNISLTDAIKEDIRERLAKLSEHATRLKSVQLSIHYQNHKSHTEQFELQAIIHVGRKYFKSRVVTSDYYEGIGRLEHSLLRDVRRCNRMFKTRRQASSIKQ